jgi:hypothetical protein
MPSYQQCLEHPLSTSATITKQQTCYFIHDDGKRHKVVLPVGTVVMLLQTVTYPSASLGNSYKWAVIQCPETLNHPVHVKYCYIKE